jgi:pimeloyl-ACP methyl ester carboxylesterase
MITLLVALGFGCSFLGLGVLFQFWRRKSRTMLLCDLELRPNCLLTRHPLVFISGRSSPFRLFDHWNLIPGFLHEHGYETLILEPVALIGHSVGSAASLIAALDDLPECSHLIATSCSRRELEAIANSKHHKIASLTVVENPARLNWLSRLISNLTKWVQPLTTTQLRPLANAVETFELSSVPRKRRFHLSDLGTYVILGLHNFWALVRNHGRIDGLEVAEYASLPLWWVECQYLDLAIQLAERDCSIEHDRFNTVIPDATEHMRWSTSAASGVP